MQNYVVEKHDTLWKIGKRFGVSVEALAHANSLRGRQIHRLRIGQNLRIPGGDAEGPDTILAIRFRGLDHRPFTPPKIKVEHDSEAKELAPDARGIVSLSIFDHAKGLKIWIEDLTNQFVQVLDKPILPVGKWNVSLDSRKVAAKGQLMPTKGLATTTTAALKATASHNAQVGDGTTVETQARTEQGKPVHALATIYVEENLRLVKANEPYRKHIVAAAKKYGLTPQSLAALIDAEAAKNRKTGAWLERSNSHDATLAQGLAQFFEAAWIDVAENEKSLLYAECRGLSRRALLAKRLEARYAIDSAATYAHMNLRNFARRSKCKVDALQPEDKAKLAYVLHHDGLEGTLRLIGKAEARTQAEAKRVLVKQFGGDEVKADALIKRHRGNANNAYKAWLFGYTDALINVNNFLVKDKLEFSKATRSTEEIFRGFGGEASDIRPLPRPAPKPAARTPEPAPAPATTSGGWHDPLARCTLRTAGLASVRSAAFGMVRNRGTRPHQGIDLIAAPGTTVFAVADGVVHYSTARNGGDYGKTLVLEVSIDDLPEKQAAVFRRVNPNRETIGFFYAHLSEYSVQPGPVSAGTAIAKSGATGNASKMTTVALGAHLHFEVRLSALGPGKGLTNRTNPIPFLQNCSNAP